MDLGIGGRVALVTAASKGLGRATAMALAHEGVKVAICARGAEKLEEARAELAAHTDVLAMAADVTDPDVPRRLVEQTVARFGSIDILVANAGGPPAARALELDDAALRAALDANLHTSIRLVREAVPHMREAGWGRICLMTSSSIKEPIPTLAASNTARTALWAWATTAAADVFADGITLNLACPGLHATERMHELGLVEKATRIGNPSDFGRVVAFLCSESARYISGTTLLVDGARSLGLT